VHKETGDRLEQNTG